jgi:hypothetical protein
LVAERSAAQILLAVIAAPLIVIAMLLALRLWRRRVREFRAHLTRAG